MPTKKSEKASKRKAKRPSAASTVERIQRTLVKTAIALPLYDKIDAERSRRHRAGGETEYDVIIDVHLDFPAGRKQARAWILDTLAKLLGSTLKDSRLKPAKNADQPQYVFARLDAATIQRLVICDGLHNDTLSKGSTELRLPPGLPAKDLPSSWPKDWAMPQAVYQVWEDFEISPLISSTISTVKADAARAAFRAAGTDIVWAVIDSGIKGDHEHFARHRNLQEVVAGWHRDFTQDNPAGAADAALVDDFGHGTHVAGIIAGEIPPQPGVASHPTIRAYQRILNTESHDREIIPQQLQLETISGMAPRAGLVSLKVLGADGKGNVSNIIAALNWVQEVNGYGRRIRIHGVNLSVGYPFDVEWFACGQSQLCVEVDRLVRSGVVVVVAAGNTGYGVQVSDALGARKGGLALTINDPGNAELAITVGATHRDMPHVYGVSYFSGKGPTGDGRMKPDVVAPGEKVISSATGKLLADVVAKLPEGAPSPNYIEYTGTSMAAPHVSGCIASFLSAKREFIGRPERVKEIFIATATNLGRDRNFQGAGLIDLMRAIQYV